MSARFGRNKRRAAREALAEATAALLSANRRVSILSAQVADAEERGMRRLLNDPERIDFAMREISRELARKLPDELLPHAEKLLKADVRREAPLKFDAHVPIDQTFRSIDIQGRVDLRFAFRVAQW